MNIVDSISLVEAALLEGGGMELPTFQAELLIAAVVGRRVEEVEPHYLCELSDEEQNSVCAYLNSRPLLPVPLYLGYTEMEGVDGVSPCDSPARDRNPGSATAGSANRWQRRFIRSSMWVRAPVSSL